MALKTINARASDPANDEYKEVAYLARNLNKFIKFRKSGYKEGEKSIRRLFGIKGEYKKEENFKDSK